MLELLHIENIAIIERADILFGRGFNALTGETGAGKSIVIDALGAVLGQRTSRELIRTGAEKAFVSATFSAVPADLPGLAENGFTPEEDGTLLLQRELYGDGKNVCRVGGRPVTVAQLKRIGASLLNIHGQHDGQQLLDEEQHLVYLDRFGRVENELAAYCTRYDVMKETRRAIDALKMDEAEKARRVALGEACLALCWAPVDLYILFPQRLLQQRFRDERRRLAHEPVEPLPGVVPADGKFLHCPSASVSSRSIFRSARRRKNAVAHADTTSAIGKHHHTLPTFPVSDRRYAAGMSATT